MRWGTFGRPVLVFPPAGGDAQEIERFGLVDACGHLCAEGRIKLYSVDSVAGQAMITARQVLPEHRMWLLNQFHQCASGMRSCQRSTRISGGQALDVIASGASIGAFNAVAVLCRYPDVFSAAIGMSGSYRIERFYDQASSQDLYFSAPLRVPARAGRGATGPAPPAVYRARGRRGRGEDIGRVLADGISPRCEGDPQSGRQPGPAM